MNKFAVPSHNTEGVRADEVDRSTGEGAAQSTGEARPHSSNSMHKCAAVGCEQEIQRARLMCWMHWGLVPRQLRDRIVAAWKKLRAPGMAQEWLAAVREAQAAVAEKEAQRREAGLR